jgi:hypothetical protein
MDKFDMIETILHEDNKIDARSLLIDLVDLIDDRVAERCLRDVAKNWDIDLKKKGFVK